MVRENSEYTHTPDADPGRVNCLSFVLFSLGVLETEIYVDPLNQYFAVRELFTEVETIEDADMIAIEDGGKLPKAIHAMLVDKSDPDFAMQRPGYGAPVERVRVKDFIEPNVEEMKKQNMKLVNLKLTTPIERKLTTEDLPRVVLTSWGFEG